AQVIGMNTAIAGGTTDGTSAQNIGFAIPSGKIESLLPMLEKGGTIVNGGGVLGVAVETLTSQLRQQYGFTPKSGAVVQTVVLGSPANQAGIRQGDVVVAVGSTAITTADQLQAVIEGHKPGDQVQVTYYRGDLKKSVSATLESQDQLQQQEQAHNGLTTPTATAPSGPTGTGSNLSPFGP
ncbi:MAG: S1C family serine protease, partial [Acidimicrobiales bacterium]